MGEKLAQPVLRKALAAGTDDLILLMTVRALSVGTAVTVMGDVAKSKDIERMVRIVLEFGCRPDVLSNNCSLIK